jgi:hypothetical protein
MSAKPRILLQLDSDPQPSVFDRVVAVDAGCDHVFAHGGIRPETVRDLVHGAIFTRGGSDLKRTAIFVGGSSVAMGDEILARVKQAFFGQLRVSVLLDPNGSNTTAAAAVVVAGRHLTLSGCSALVLGSTGPVGRRVARLLAREGARVSVASRGLERSRDVAETVALAVPGVSVTPVVTSAPAELQAALEGVELVIAAGGPGACLLPLAARQAASSLQVAIDLNAVPPLGIEGVKSGDAGADRQGHIAHGAIGVGGLKMAIHKAAIARLFEANDLILDAEEVLAIGKAVSA